MTGMPRKACLIKLSSAQRSTLENLVRQPKAQARFVERARIIMWADEDLGNTQIAQRLNTRLARVSKWRTRFASEGLDGLWDDFRPGRPPIHDPHKNQRRVLEKLDQPPPSGFAQWNGPLLAKALGLSVHQVWQMLRRQGISLQRRRSWCISTDPEFSAKAADVVGLYLHPPENAVVLAVDEKPHIQALARAQGWLKLPNGRALSGFNHEYERCGTSTLFAALNVATGQVKAGHYGRRRRVEFLDFMNEVVAEHPGREIHVVLDNLNTHKPKEDRWLRRHPKVHFHFTPTHASWLNQIEVWFSILSRQALRQASFSSVSALREAMDAFIAAYNPTAHPFEWRKVNVRAKTPSGKYANLNK
jgi:transposase